MDMIDAPIDARRDVAERLHGPRVRPASAARATVRRALCDTPVQAAAPRRGRTLAPAL